MKDHFLHIIIALAFVLSCPAFAQNQQLSQFSVEDGLPQSQVYDMVQDHQGYLWLATQGGGLARFDGSDFKVYNTSNGLQDNYINALFASKDSLFIGTARGLSIKVKEQFLFFKIPSINSIKQISSKTFLLTDSGLYQISESTQDGQTLKTEKVSLGKILDTSQINDMVYDGNHYYIASNSGLFRIKGFDGRIPEQLVKDDFVALLEFQNRILAATANEGLVSFKAGQFEDALLVLENFRITDISVQKADEIWITTENRGIFRLDVNSHQAFSIIDSNQGLSIQNVRRVLTDRQSNIWIASSGGGFYKYFQNNFKHYNTGPILSGNRIDAIHSNKEGVWISHSETGISKINNYRIQNIKTPENFLDTKFKTINSDKKGNLYLGSEGKGIWLRHLEIRDSFIEDKRKISEIRKIKIPLKSISEHEISTNTGFPFDWIRSISTHVDTVWASSYSSGIVKFSYQPDLEKPLRIYDVFSTDDGILDIYINHSLYHRNKLWYATQNGHLGFVENNKVSHLGKILGDEVVINSILIYNDLMFLGTAGRGIWWSLLDNQLNFKKLKGAKSLTSENSNQLIFDDDGYLWSGSERGVDKIDLNQDTEIMDVFHFGQNGGFTGIETSLNSVDKDERGHLWFGTVNGLTEFIPSGENYESIAPKLYIEDLKVNLKSVDSLDLDNLGESDDKLILAPDQNQVSFSFKSVDLNHPNSIEYRTKWNDFDWTEWTTNNSRDFSGLSFGAHTFSVQSRNYRWQESDVKQISFFIERPLHRKMWFQWLILGIIVFILALSIGSYIKRLKQKNRRVKQQLEIENYLLELEQKALRLQMNPHFMFNVLNGIKAMAKTRPDAMKDTINDFAALLRSTLTSSRKATISLKDEIEALQHYIKLEQQMTQKPFEYKIDLESDYAPEDILVPPMLIQPFVENAIRHGILKGNRRGKLQIEFFTTETVLKVKISDNGIGMFESQKMKLAKDHQSMALNVTMERLESISGKESLKIIELKNNRGKTIGTEVKFEIPLETEY